MHRLGFSKCIVPMQQADKLNAPGAIQLIPVKNIGQVLQILAPTSYNLTTDDKRAGEGFFHLPDRYFFTLFPAFPGLEEFFAGSF